MKEARSSNFAENDGGEKEQPPGVGSGAQKGEDGDEKKMERESDS